MGLLDILEGAFLSRKKTVQVDLKEIFCKRKDDGCIQCFNTAAVGCEHSNADGSDRQTALEQLKPGQRVRLIWDATGGKDKVYLLRGGGSRELALSSCFGRLNDKTAGEVIGWLTRDHVVTAATVARVTGGTRKKPKLGCVLELRTYPAPKKS